MTPDKDVDKEFQKLIKDFGEVSNPEPVLALQEFSNLAAHLNDAAAGLTHFITLALECEGLLESVKLSETAPGVFDAAVALMHSIMEIVNLAIDGEFACPECGDEECDCEEDDQE